jgi:TolB protein
LLRALEPGQISLQVSGYGDTEECDTTRCNHPGCTRMASFSSDIITVEILPQTPENVDAPSGRIVVAPINLGDPKDFSFYTIEADGSNLTRHVSNDLQGINPSRESPIWSPNYQYALVEDINSNRLYVLNADASLANEIVVDELAGSDNEFNPVRLVYSTWSPDSQRVAFPVKNRDGSADNIYTANRDGSGLTRLTHDSKLRWCTKWSPNGEQIAFLSTPDEASPDMAHIFDLYVMNADGSNQTRLTYNNELSCNFAWSPDSRQIAFGRGKEDTFNIYTVNIDGTNLTKTASIPPPGFITHLSWSPDGQRLAVHVDSILMRLRSGEALETINEPKNEGYYPSPYPHHLFVVNVDGSELVTICSNHCEPQFFNELSIWSPDGQYLAFVAAMQGEDRGVYIARADGSTPQNIFPDKDAGSVHAWLP